MLPNNCKDIIEPKTEASKVSLVILFGGKSSEHEVSRKSACAVLENLNCDKYNVHVVGITKHGDWYLTNARPDEIKDGTWETLKDNKKAILSPSNTTAGLLIYNKSGFEEIRIDVVWPVLHGKYGEDGTIQGLCELAGMKYVGPNVGASATCMDKIMTKLLVSHSNVRQAKYLFFNKYDYAMNNEFVVNKIDTYFGSYPLFVKPANAGSSVGISKVSCKEEIKEALEIAYREDDRVLIEVGIVGQEVEVAVLGNENPRVSRVGEILPAADWYDYDSKYKNVESRTLIPARITEVIEKEIQKAAVEVYKIMNCRGISRVDFFACENGEVIFNEINTLPGFTEISMYPKLWEATGVKYSELLDEIINYALEEM